jgi:hypothetical protein
MQVLRDYHVVSLRDFTAIGGSDVEGRVAVFGDMAISNYSVSFVVAPPPAYVNWFGRTVTDRHDLVVCGKLTFLSGAVMGGGNALYVDAGSDIREPIASVYPPGKFMQVCGGPRDAGGRGGGRSAPVCGWGAAVRQGWGRVAALVFDGSCVSVVGTTRTAAKRLVFETRTRTHRLALPTPAHRCRRARWCGRTWRRACGKWRQAWLPCPAPVPPPWSTRKCPRGHVSAPVWGDAFPGRGVL